MTIFLNSFETKLQNLTNAWMAGVWLYHIACGCF